MVITIIWCCMGGYHKLEIEYGIGDLVSRTKGKMALSGLIKSVAHWKKSPEIENIDSDRYQPANTRFNF
jgi:hypothetical protein